MRRTKAPDATQPVKGTAEDSELDSVCESSEEEEEQDDFDAGEE